MTSSNFSFVTGLMMLSQTPVNENSYMKDLGHFVSQSVCLSVCCLSVYLSVQQPTLISYHVHKNLVQSSGCWDMLYHFEHS